MKKIKILSFLYISLILTSCLNYKQITTIKTDNSGKMFIHYWIKMNPNLDSLLTSKIGLFNGDSLKNQFQNRLTSINFANVYQNLKDSTLNAQIEFEFTNFDSLNKIQFFKHSELSIKNGPKKTKIFSQFIQPITTGIGFSDTSWVISYTYYLPGEILSHNANSISRNKLEWTFTSNEIGRGKLISAIYIPFRLKETPSWIYYLMSFVIVIVLIFLFKKRKK